MVFHRRTIVSLLVSFLVLHVPFYFSLFACYSMNYIYEGLLIIRSAFNEIRRPDGAYGFNPQLWRLSSTPFFDLALYCDELNNYSYAIRMGGGSSDVMSLYQSVINIYNLIPHDPAYWVPAPINRPATLFRLYFWFLDAEFRVDFNIDSVTREFMDFCMNCVFLLTYLENQDPLPDFHYDLIDRWWYVILSAETIITSRAFLRHFDDISSSDESL